MPTPGRQGTVVRYGLLAIGLLGPTLIVGRTTDEFTVGLWAGKAYWSATGFGHCTAARELANGNIVLLSMAEKRLVVVSYQQPRWGLQTDGKYTVDVSLDDVALGQRYAEVVTGDVLQVKLAATVENLPLQLRAATNLVINTGSQLLHVPLEGAYATLMRLEQCVHTATIAGRASRGDAPTIAASQVTAPPVAPQPHTTARAEATPREVTLPEYAFAYTLPANWIEIPVRLVNEQAAKLTTTEVQKRVAAVAAFYKGRDRDRVHRPFGTFTVAPTGWAKLPTPRQFDLVVKAMSVGTEAQIANSTATGQFSSSELAEMSRLMRGTTSSAVHSDSKAREYWRLTDGTDSEGYPVRALSAGRFLANGNLLMINCFADAEEFDRYIPDFTDVLQSVRDVSR